MNLTNRDRERLRGVHSDLVAVVERAAMVPGNAFMVLEGVRTLKRQQELLAKGATTTLRSRHLTGHAVDLAPFLNGTASWHWPHYHALAPIVKAAAEELGVKITWGGDWVSFKDGPHWELMWDAYPGARLDATDEGRL